MYDPPALPPAGWYPDPDRPGTRRWWNGRDWDAVWDSGTPVGPSGRLPDIGDWLNSSFRLAFGRWRASLLIGLVSAALSTVLVGLALGYVFADVVITEDEVFGWSSDRLPLAFVLMLAAIFVGIVGQLGLTILMLRTADGEAPAESTEGEFRLGGSAMMQAVRVLPRAIGWSILLGLAAMAIILAVVGMIVVILPLGVLLVLALVPAMIYVGVGLAFVTQSIVDRPGQPFSRSWDVSRGRWWATFGRLLLVGLIAWLASFVLQTISGLLTGNFGGGFGQGGFEIDDDDVVRIEMADVFPSSALAITVGVVVAIATTVLVTSVVSVAFSLLYRTRNPRT